MPNLNPTQQAIINNLLALQYQEGDAFYNAYLAFLDDEENFTFEECESISMYYGWA